MNKMEAASFIHNNQGMTLKFTTLPALLDKRAQDTPRKPVFIFRRVTAPDRLERTVLTYSELAEKSSNVAASMLQMGIKPQDKIAVIGSNCPEYIVLENACLRINVLMLRLPETIMNKDVLLKTLNKYYVRAFVLDDAQMENKLEEIVPGLLRSDSSRCAEYGLTQLEHIFLLRHDESSVGTRRAVDSMGDTQQDTRPIIEIQRAIDPDDDATIYPTSGSTGAPKFVLWSHFNIINAMTFTVHQCIMQPGEDLPTVFLLDRPFSWIGGFSILPVVSGDTQISLTNLCSTTNERVSVFIESARAEDATATICIGYTLYDLMHTMGNRHLELPKRLQHILTGGERVSSDAIAFAKRNFTRVSLVYGTSELCHVVAGTSAAVANEYVIESISWMAPLKSVQVKIVDDTERILPLGEVGNVFCRSMFRMTGYLDDPESTNEVFTSTGWYRTGDVGLINNHGQLKVIGRATEIISIGGNKVYPAAVEILVSKHPKVQKVVAVAVPDPRLFNEVCACVIPKIDQVLSVNELKSFCDQQILGDNSLVIPRYYFIVKEFPQGATGKIDRKRLTELAIKNI